MRITPAAAPVLGTVAAVAAVAVGISLVHSGGSPSHRPAVLHLAGGVARDAAGLAPTAQGGAVAGTNPGYTLTGTLPSGQPADAPAYLLPKGPADAALVSRLAQVLGAGTPERDGSGWKAGGLLISGDAGQNWWFSPCADQAVSSDGSRTACAIAVPGSGSGSTSGSTSGGTSSGSGGAATPDASPDASPGTKTEVAPPPPSPAPEPAPMDTSAVRTAVAPVFDALGLDVSLARLDGWAYGGSATLDRTMDGRLASGLATSVQVDRDGHIQGASGYLATPAKGDAYPLVTAQEAFDALPIRPIMMLCPVTPDGKGCAAPEPTQITGAHLGLMLQQLADGALALVPAWLFDVKDEQEPIAVVAVQKQYLAQPEAQPERPTDVGTPSTGGGTTGPGQPVPPPAPETKPTP